MRSPLHVTARNAGPGIIISSGPGGPVFRLSGVRPDKRSASLPHPFQLRGFVTPEPYAEGAIFKGEVAVYPGIVDNIIPTLDGVPLTGMPSLNVTGEMGWIWIECQLNQRGKVVSAKIQQGKIFPPDSIDKAHRMLGVFTASAPIFEQAGVFTSLFSLLRHNQSHVRCAGVSSWGDA